MSPLRRIEISQCRVNRDAVVLESISRTHLLQKRQHTYPHDDRTRLVSRTDLKVGTLADVVVQKLEKVLGFLGLEPNDAANETGVDVERFFARHRVTTDEGVLSTDVVFALRFVPSVRRVRTSVSMGSRRTGPPRRREDSACSWALCIARRPSRRFLNSGERRL